MTATLLPRCCRCRVPCLANGRNVLYVSWTSATAKLNAVPTDLSSLAVQRRSGRISAPSRHCCSSTPEAATSSSSPLRLLDPAAGTDRMNVLAARRMPSARNTSRRRTTIERPSGSDRKAQPTERKERDNVRQSRPKERFVGRQTKSLSNPTLPVQPSHQPRSRPSGNRPTLFRPSRSRSPASYRRRPRAPSASPRRRNRRPPWGKS